MNRSLEPTLAPSLPRIFVIGFNKCGTRTIAHYLTANGLPTLHWKVDKVNVVKQMQENLAAGRSIIAGYESFIGFSDLICVTSSEHIEGNAYFPNFLAEFPDAYFIFNDRDPERWVASRYRHPDFTERQCAYYGVGASDLRRIWLDQYERHKAAVLACFEGSPNFTVFNIEVHGPGDLNAFLSRHYVLEPSHWQYMGKTSPERKSALEANS